MKFNKNKILKASEIAQYSYCSIAWFLQRQGVKSESPLLDKGTEKHIDLGEKVTAIQQKEKSSKQTAYIGYGLLGIAILFLLIWLIL